MRATTRCRAGHGPDKRCQRFYRRDRPGHHGAKQGADLGCDHQLGRPRTPRMGCCAVRPDLSIGSTRSGRPAAWTASSGTTPCLSALSWTCTPQSRPASCGLLRISRCALACHCVNRSELLHCEAYCHNLHRLGARAGAVARGSGHIGTTSSCLEGEPADDANAATFPRPSCDGRASRAGATWCLLRSQTGDEGRRSLGTGPAADSSRRGPRMTRTQVRLVMLKQQDRGLRGTASRHATPRGSRRHQSGLHRAPLFGSVVAQTARDLKPLHSAPIDAGVAATRSRP